MKPRKDVKPKLQLESVVAELKLSYFSGRLLSFVILRTRQCSCCEYETEKGCETKTIAGVCCCRAQTVVCNFSGRLLSFVILGTRQCVSIEIKVCHSVKWISNINWMGEHWRKR